MRNKNNMSRELVGGFAKFLADVVKTDRDPTDASGARVRLAEHERGIMQARSPSGLGETVPADGGFLLAPQVADEIVMRVHEESAVMSRVTQWEVSESNRAGLRIPTFDESSRADGSRWGGVRGYWGNEADAITASQPKVAAIQLNPKKVSVLVYLTSELLADMNALARFLILAFTKELAFKTVDGVVAGDGTGKPQGILYSPARVTVAKQGGQSSGTILSQNVLDMLGRFWVGSHQNETSAWFCNSDALAKLPGMTLAVGTSLSALYDSDTRRMLGFPVIPIEQCKTVGTEGDIILADFSEYHVAWRDRGSFFTSMHVKFTTDEQAMRLTARVDGQGGWQTPVTPLNGTNTQSPFVTLAAR